MKAALPLLASLLAIGTAAQERNGSIIGVVSDSVSHQPLRNVMITLVFGTQLLEPQVVTSDDGTFAFHDLKPGQYRLGAERRDYPDPKTMAISPAEDPDPVTIELVPGAAVAGRILDEDGDPLRGCWAQARPVEHPESNRFRARYAQRLRAKRLPSLRAPARKIHIVGAVRGSSLPAQAVLCRARSAAVARLSTSVLSGCFGRRLCPADRTRRGNRNNRD